jgi:hypothetical protein
MSPDHCSGHIILRSAVFDLLLNHEPLREIGHTEVPQYPCSPILDVFAAFFPSLDFFSCFRRLHADSKVLTRKIV